MHKQKVDAPNPGDQESRDHSFECVICYKRGLIYAHECIHVLIGQEALRSNCRARLQGNRRGVRFASKIVTQ